jgi:Flp pilus assembly protein CpaB
MEAHGNFGGKLGSRRPGSALTDRRTPVLIAIVSAVLAGLLIYLFVSHYHKTPVVVAPAEMTVFEARTYIPRGTPQSTVAAGGMLKPVRVPVTQAIGGAITDPSEITGEVSATAISAGQQVSTADFTHGNITIGAYLKGDERAVAFSLDSEHGLTSYITAGDTVDIMGLDGGKAEMLAENVSVIANEAGNVVLRVTDKQALQLTSATGVSSLWLTLRPAAGAKDSVKVGTVENS